MVQILPPDDDFAAGTPAYGALPCLYLGAPVSTSNVTFWLPSSAAFVVRPMHGAYQTTNSHGIPDYNAAFHDNGSSTARSASGAMFRKPFGANVTVSGLFEMRAVAGGPPGIADLAPRGVFARCAAGTLAGDGTADVRLANIDAYMAAVYQKASDSSLRLGIIRWNAGVGTVLVESIALQAAIVSYVAPCTITLTPAGTGGAIALGATLKGFGTSGTVSINTVDSSGSRIQVAGRCGLFMGADHIIAGKTVVDLCHMLAVDEGGVRVLQDEFRRLSLSGSKQTSVDAAGTTGSGYLNSAFYWDAGTFDGTDVEGAVTYVGSKRLRRVGDTIDFDNQLTDDDLTTPTGRHAPGRMLLSQRPADNLFSQHRSASVTIPSAPTASTGEVWAGIALRAAQTKPRDQTVGTPGQTILNNPDVPGGTGYVFALRGKTSTQVIWQLHRIVNNAQTPLASLTENSPFTIFAGYGTVHTLELEVYPRDTSEPFGVVEIVCKVNGSNIAMTLVGPPTGVTNPATGVFHDGSANRIQSGAGEGLFTSNGLTSSGSTAADIDPVFDLWTQGALTNVTVLDVDQPSIAVASESAAVGTTLSLGPDWPFEQEYRTWSIDIPFASGHRQSCPRFVEQGTDTLIGRKLFRFTKQGASEDELTTLRTHYDTHAGVELAFTFAQTGDVVHYTSPIVSRMTAPNCYDVSFELEEVYG